MTDITAEREIREALAAGPTPGPWQSVTEPFYNGWWVVGDRDGDELGSGDGGLDKQDADYISACNPANIAAILAELDRLRACHKELVAEIETLLLENGALRPLTAIDAARKGE